MKEINSVNDSSNIYELSYTRQCILESLRLNNLVVTTFRTLLQDFTFDNKYSFKKGTQFLILNNPVLREKEYFEKPDQFIPERWTPEMEKSYYAISFNQGPQRCPGKELAIYIMSSFIVNLFKHKGILSDIYKIQTKDINAVLLLTSKEVSWFPEQSKRSNNMF